MGEQGVGIIDPRLLRARGLGPFIIMRKRAFAAAIFDQQSGQSGTRLGLGEILRQRLAILLDRLVNALAVERRRRPVGMEARPAHPEPLALGKRRACLVQPVGCSECDCLVMAGQRAGRIGGDGRVERRQRFREPPVILERHCPHRKQSRMAGEARQAGVRRLDRDGRFARIGSGDGAV